MCNESQWINLTPGANPLDNDVCVNGTGSAPCLLLEFRIVPFTMQVEINNKKALPKGPPYLSAAAEANRSIAFAADLDCFTATGQSSDAYCNKIDRFVVLGHHFGRLYQDLKMPYKISADWSYPGSIDLQGGLMYSFFSTDKISEYAGDVLSYISVNFPARVYVCRSDVDNEAGIPAWLASWDQSRLSTTRLLVRDNNTKVFFGCFSFLSEGTRKNAWGGVLGGQY